MNRHFSHNKMLLRALPLCAAALAAQTHLYVSPSGADTNPGTQAAPFLSVQRAQQAARLLAPTLTDDLLVHLRAGAYYQGATVSFSEADSGPSASARVRYVGGWEGDAPGAPSIIHMGLPVTGWVLADAAQQIWSAPLPSPILDTRQVWNISAGGASLPKAAAGGLGRGAAITAWGYTALAANAPWLTDAHQNAADVEFLYTGVGSSWTECRLRVASIAPLPGGLLNITMAQPAWSFHKRSFGQALTYPASSANLYAGLRPGTPGSFYVNSASQTLYWSAPEGAQGPPTGLMVPAQDVLMQLAGASWLSFEGLQFSFAGWLEPNSGLGYVDMQSGYRIVQETANPSDDDQWVPVPGNIQVHGSRNISFLGNTFAGLGATALTILDSSQSVAVLNNTFSDVACSGLGLGQVSDVNTTAAKENGYFVAEGNLFLNIPNEYHDCPGILGGYIVGSSIANNAIINASNGGICVGWGWSRDEAVNAGWNNISRNYIYRSNWLLEDCGSIYVCTFVVLLRVCVRVFCDCCVFILTRPLFPPPTFPALMGKPFAVGPQPESLMAEIFCSGQVKLYGALYTDEGSAYWHITRNVVHNVPEWLHIWIATIHDELVDWNWSDQTYQVVQ